MGRLLRAFRHLLWQLFKLTVVALVLLAAWVWFGNAYPEAPPAVCATRPPVGLDSLEAKAPGYQQPEAATYLALPERLVAHSADEYARALAGGHPSGFPYFRSIAQYWRGYYRMFKITQAKYGVTLGQQLAPVLMGLGYTAEHAVKAVYERTIGRLTERASDGGRSDEDKVAARVAADYAAFARTRPFYDFAFGAALKDLWQTPIRGAHQARKIERRIVLTTEYGLRRAYGWLVGIAAKPPPADAKIHAFTMVNRSPQLVPLSRDDRFTAELSALAGKVQIYEIAGNDEIFLTATAPATWQGTIKGAASSGDGGNGPFSTAGPWRVEFIEPLPTAPATARIGLTVPVSCLNRALAELQSTGATLERVYAY
jgi:hypothetical protein